MGNFFMPEVQSSSENRDADLEDENNQDTTFSDSDYAGTQVEVNAALSGYLNSGQWIKTEKLGFDVKYSHSLKLVDGQWHWFMGEEGNEQTDQTEQLKNTGNAEALKEHEARIQTMISNGAADKLSFKTEILTGTEQEEKDYSKVDDDTYFGTVWVLDQKDMSITIHDFKYVTRELNFDLFRLKGAGETDQGLDDDDELSHQTFLDLNSLLSPASNKTKNETSSAQITKNLDNFFDKLFEPSVNFAAVEFRKQESSFWDLPETNTDLSNNKNFPYANNFTTTGIKLAEASKQKLSESEFSTSIKNAATDNKQATTFQAAVRPISIFPIILNHEVIGKKNQKNETRMEPVSYISNLKIELFKPSPVKKEPQLIFRQPTQNIAGISKTEREDITQPNKLRTPALTEAATFSSSAILAPTKTTASPASKAQRDRKKTVRLPVKKIVADKEPDEANLATVSDLEITGIEGIKDKEVITIMESTEHSGLAPEPVIIKNTNDKLGTALISTPITEKVPGNIPAEEYLAVSSKKINDKDQTAGENFIQIEIKNSESAPRVINQEADILEVAEPDTKAIPEDQDSAPQAIEGAVTLATTEVPEDALEENNGQQILLGEEVLPESFVILHSEKDTGHEPPKIELKTETTALLPRVKEGGLETLKTSARLEVSRTSKTNQEFSKPKMLEKATLAAGQLTETKAIAEKSAQLPIQEKAPEPEAKKSLAVPSAQTFQPIKPIMRKLIMEKPMARIAAEARILEKFIGKIREPEAIKNIIREPGKANYTPSQKQDVAKPLPKQRSKMPSLLNIISQMRAQDIRPVIAQNQKLKNVSGLTIDTFNYRGINDIITARPLSNSLQNSPRPAYIENQIRRLTTSSPIIQNTQDDNYQEDLLPTNYQNIQLAA